jgi:small subunit ribosomal protein S18
MKKMINPKKYRNKRQKSPILTGEIINYKNVALLQKLISEQGKILSRKVNRLTAKQQRASTKAIKNARILAILHFNKNET